MVKACLKTFCFTRNTDFYIGSKVLLTISDMSNDFVLTGAFVHASWIAVNKLYLSDSLNKPCHYDL